MRRPLLGNDVIDLAEARTLRKELDGRFLARVFTPLERECIDQAADPALALWMIWAAKESLFKIAARENPLAVFAHRNFPVPGLARIADAQNGSLQLGQGSLQFAWDWNEDRLHCVVSDHGWTALAEEGAGTDELALRLLAVPLARIERFPGPSRPLAPVAVLGDAILPVTVSLSHDGRFAAAALIRSPS